jgi:hypothetical protein
MTRQEWIDQCVSHSEVLANFLNTYGGSVAAPPMRITAPAAEHLTTMPPDPNIWTAARVAQLAAQQPLLVSSALNRAWFRVPESTSCWRIKGFSEAVDLIEQVDALW